MSSTPGCTVLSVCNGGRFKVVLCGPHGLAPEIQGVRSRVELSPGWELLTVKTLGLQEWEELCCLSRGGVHAPPSRL